MIELEEIFDGHIILYCKGHYRVEGVDFISGLQRIWAVRCGIELKYIKPSMNEYIADKLHEIFAKCTPKKLHYFHQILYKGLCDEWNYKGLSGIERVIMVYANELMGLQIKESTIKGKYKTLIKLPKPQKQLFKRIVRGNIQKGDYYKVKY